MTSTTSTWNIMSYIIVALLWLVGSFAGLFVLAPPLVSAASTGLMLLGFAVVAAILLGNLAMLIYLVRKLYNY